MVMRNVFRAPVNRSIDGRVWVHLPAQDTHRVKWTQNSVSILIGGSWLKVKRDEDIRTGTCTFSTTPFATSLAYDLLIESELIRKHIGFPHPPRIPWHKRLLDADDDLACESKPGPPRVGLVSPSVLEDDDTACENRPEAVGLVSPRVLEGD